MLKTSAVLMMTDVVRKLSTAGYRHRL